MSVACSHGGAPRQTSAPACPFCKSLYGDAAPAGAPPGAPAGVLEALAAGNKIEAIRLYQKSQRVSLLEAKNAVERLERAIAGAR